MDEQNAIPQAPRPDVTLAQVIGLLVGGVPIVSKLLLAFGVYAVSVQQQSALSDAVQWGCIVAGTLFVSDAGLRAARNHASAKVESAALMPTLTALGPPMTVGERVPGGEEGLPTDEEEFAAGAPAVPDGESDELPRS